MGGPRSHPGTLLHSCPQGQMLSAAGFRQPGRPGRNPLPPGGDQREIRFLQGLGKWGQGLPPDLPSVTSTTTYSVVEPGLILGTPIFLISLRLCHLSSCGCPRLILLRSLPPILVIASQLVSLLPVWTTTLVSTQKLGQSFITVIYLFKLYTVNYTELKHTQLDTFLYT